MNISTYSGDGADFGVLLRSVLKLTHASVNPGTGRCQEESRPSQTTNKRIAASQNFGLLSKWDGERKSSQFPESADVSTGPAARLFSVLPLFWNVLLRWFLSAFRGKCYSFKMDTFAKATSTPVSRQVAFPRRPVRRNLRSPPTRLPDPATRTVPPGCGGGRSQPVWQGRGVSGEPQRAPSTQTSV